MTKGSLTPVCPSCGSVDTVATEPRRRRCRRCFTEGSEAKFRCEPGDVYPDARPREFGRILATPTSDDF